MDQYDPAAGAEFLATSPDPIYSSDGFRWTLVGYTTGVVGTMGDK